MYFNISTTNLFNLIIISAGIGINRDPQGVPEEALSNVLADIHSFVGGAEQFDDITMLCIKYNGPTDKQQAS